MRECLNCGAGIPEPRTGPGYELRSVAEEEARIEATMTEEQRSYVRALKERFRLTLEGPTIAERRLMLQLAAIDRIAPVTARTTTEPYADQGPLPGIWHRRYENGREELFVLIDGEARVLATIRESDAAAVTDAAPALTPTPEPLGRYSKRGDPSPGS